MVEDSIVAYVETNTDLAAGVDLYLSHLPSGVKEGVIIQTGNRVGRHSLLEHMDIRFIILYFDNMVAKARYTELFNLMNLHDGYLSSTWAVSSDIHGEELGVERETQQYGYTVTFEVTYKQT